MINHTSAPVINTPSTAGQDHFARQANGPQQCEPSSAGISARPTSGGVAARARTTRREMLRRLAELRHDVLREELLRLDRLPVVHPARIRGDRDLRQPLADADRL